MIISRYMLREIGVSFLVVTLVLSLMFLSGTLMRLLADMLQGKYQADLLFTLLGLRTLGNLVLILPFALFIAVMMALGRLYRDSEMVVLSACGYGPKQIFMTVSVSAVIASVLIALMALFVAPWAEDRAVAVMDEAGVRLGVESLEPGRFSKLGDAVIYVETVDATNKTLYGILATEQGLYDSTQLVAEEGREYIDKDSGKRFILLLNGTRYEKLGDGLAYRITQFAEHGLHIDEPEVVPTQRRRSAVASGNLWRSDILADQIELQWRIAMPLSAFLLTLLAVPLSRSAPRQGRLLGIFVGIMIYMAYSNLLNVARSSINKGDLPAWMGLWWVHLLLISLTLFLLWRQRRRFTGRRK